MVAKQLGIDEVEAGVSPQDKHDRVRALRARAVIVWRWPATASTMRRRWRRRMSASRWGRVRTLRFRVRGVTLLKGDLGGIVRSIRLSRDVMRNIRQNLFFAFVYNALGVPMAAGVLYPWTGMLLNPMIAAAAMSFSSVSVITNALRLRAIKSKS